MDTVKAEFLATKLIGNKIDRWSITKLIDHGKSAAVFFGEDENGDGAAIKIFDDELIERYGDKAQLARIERELTLVGKHHPNMVRILGGGFDSITSNHYIVMEYIAGSNLKKMLSEVPLEKVSSLISQLASCAEFLEKEGLCHRDIKPENIIVIDDFSRLILLDFGVLKPIGQPGITDDDGVQQFIGTLQYSSPEFLLRKESDTIEGWRAITFYQIGAVLHDLIMRKELFHEYTTPYSRLVNAVQQAQPTIQNSVVDPTLIDLARACLLKDPQKRVRLVNWRMFYPSDVNTAGLSAKQRVTNKVMLVRAERSQSIPKEKIKSEELVCEVIEFLKESIHQIRQDNNSVFPPIDIVTRVRKQDKLKVRFRKSANHSLSHDLNIMIIIEVIDPSAKAISLSVSSYFDTEPKAVAASETVFHQGLYSSVAIRAAFEDCLYKVIDVAQNETAGGEWLVLKACAVDGV